jgi:heat shock protein HtpX
MFWSIIEANKRKTVLLILLMGFFLILTGAFIGMSFVDEHHPFAGIIGAFIAAAIWVAMLLMSLYASDGVLLEVSRAKEVSKETYPQLFNVVEEMVIAGSLPAMPRIYLVGDPAPNAFAMGKSPEKSYLCVTAGLLAMCSRDELQGVVAHEIGHIMNRDVLYMTVAASMLGSILLLSDMFLRSFRYSALRFAGKSRKAGAAAGVLILLSLLLAILGPVLARILYFSISRKREYLADATSARLTRYPEGLASALEKMGQYPGSLSAAPAVTAPFYIVNPGRQKLTGGVFDTHPPLLNRIRILRGMTNGAGYTDYLYAYANVTRQHTPLIPDGDMRGLSEVELRKASDEAGGTEVPAPDEVKRKAGEIIRAMNDFIFITCPCGMKLKFPPEYAGRQAACPRCRRMHTVQKPDAHTFSGMLHSSSAMGSGAPGSKVQARAQDVQYQPGQWQKITCAVCGHGYEISPCFGGSRLTCSGCGSVIRLTPASTADSRL